MQNEPNLKLDEEKKDIDKNDILYDYENTIEIKDKLEKSKKNISHMFNFGFSLVVLMILLSPFHNSTNVSNISNISNVDNVILNFLTNGVLVLGVVLILFTFLSSLVKSNSSWVNSHLNENNYEVLFAEDLNLLDVDNIPVPGENLIIK